ncbi:hypothetical protein E8E13_003304 [Curvularia kusanoi]|uniref:Protection of telomeres protein 1 n=1 Tax=Curvularia kusanoi TaxID=90978 RepID=A0A9P4T640_CURKU|nr:hypothetical protein E8E13_003304 [Curvularia kusanoi]
MAGVPGITAIKDAQGVGTLRSFIGLVVSLQDARKSRGTDWVLDFTIQDDFTIGSVGGSSSMKCRIFKPQPSLPKISGVGDIVILRNFKLGQWQERMEAIGSFNSSMLVFPADKIPVPELSQAYLLGTQRLMYHGTPGARECTIPEQKAVLSLKQSSSSSTQDVRQHAALASINASDRRKDALIKDLTFDKFYDVKAQVVNIYYSNHGTVELKVTDYTANKDLYEYVDPEVDPELAFKRDWRGPYGQVTLDVRLYEPHAAWARGSLTHGDFIALRNLRTKMSPAGKIEGILHEDRQFPDQIDVRKLFGDDPAINEIKERGEAHEQHQARRGTVHLVNAPKKPSAKASAKKKAEKREKQRLQKAAELKEIEEKQETWEVERTGVNKNILAAFTDIKPSTLSEILNNPHLNTRTAKGNPFFLPFVNCRHRSRVRVVDFFPPELEYFAHSLNDPSWTPRSKKARSWEWGFVLLLEDADVPRNTVPEQLRLIVNNDAAQHLGLPNAKDLKAEPKVLDQLKEKLFILWGNLAELKEELRARGTDLPLPPGDNRLDNKPFDCIIEEYGAEVPVSEEHPAGFQRLHKLALTKILS